MPRYHCLDTEVQICIWDPSIDDNLVSGSPPQAKSAQAIDSYSTSSPGPGIVRDMSISHELGSLYNPGQPHKVERLKEDPFRGCEGFCFLGHNIPYFLIQVGKKDLSSVKPSKEPRIEMEDLSYLRSKASLKSSPAIKGPQLPTLGPTRMEAAPGISNLGSRADVGGLYKRDSREASLESIVSLSPLSSTSLSSLHEDASKSKEIDVIIEDQILASKMTTKPSKSTEGSLETPDQSLARGSVNKPLKIVVKLSDKSFISPLSGTDEDRYDICINIFYNGEFNTSQIIKYSAWAANQNQNNLNFSGRRIDICRELPWMLITKPQNDSSRSSPGNNSTTLSPLERWNQLTNMLLIEADNWGRDEHGHRYPTGEYLELLSTKAMPYDLDTVTFGNGSKFGVIDVVITLGRFSHLSNPKPISLPHRSLPEGHIQKTGTMVHTPKASRVTLPSSAAITCLPMIPSRPTVLSDLRPFEQEVDLKGAPKFLPRIQDLGATVILSSPYNRTNPSNPKAATASTNAFHNANSQAVMGRTASITTSIPTALAIASTPRPVHPYRPKTVPQKRYRGSNSILPTLAPKRRKVINPLEELPYDLNASTYMSTRSRRGASMLFALTPPTQLEDTKKEKGTVKYAKSAVAITKPSEPAATVAPSTPKKIQIDGLKSQEPRGPAKRNARNSNCHPKYSNRPQNLRRKNSAGEWVVPTRRKSIAGERETPTNYRRQAKSVNTSKGWTGELMPRGNDKVFQPKFAAFVDNTDQDAEISQVTANGTSLAKENIKPISSAGRTNEVVITASDIKITNPIPEDKLQNIRSNRKTEVSTTAVAEGGVIVGNIPDQGEKSGNTTPEPENEPQKKKTLRIRFRQSNKISPDRVVGAGGGIGAWQAQLSVSSGFIPAPESGKKPPCSLYEEFNHLTHTTSLKGDESSNLKIESGLRLTATAHQRPKIVSGIGPSITSNSVIAPLRVSIVGTMQQAQIPGAKKPQPRFIVPDDNPRVLKLVSAQKDATEADIKKGRAQAASYNPPNKKPRTDEANNPDLTASTDKSVPAFGDGSPKSLQQDEALKCSSTSQFLSVTSTELVARSATILVDAVKLTQVNIPEEPTEHGSRPSSRLPAIETISKPAPRSRTVGPTELKALLESHDRGSAINPPLGASLGIMHTQFMTRATRKAISYKAGKATAPKEVSNKTKVSSNKLSVKCPTTSNSTLRSRSYPNKIIEKGVVAAQVKNDRNDANGAISKVEDTQNSSKAHPSGTVRDTEQPPNPRSQNGDRLQPSITVTNTNDLNVLSASEATPFGKCTTQKIKLPLLRRQKDLKILADQLISSEGEADKSSDKAETPVIKPSQLIKKPTPRCQKRKETALKASSGDAPDYKEAVDGVNVTLEEGEIGKAAGYVEDHITYTPISREPQRPSAIHDSRGALLNLMVVEKPADNFQGIQEQEASPLSALISGINPPGIDHWKPSCLCEGSTLGYAENEWDFSEKNPVTGQVYRQIETQEEGYFIAFGVLMGVRYVVVGSEVLKEKDVCYMQGSKRWTVTQA